jgi:hypothetical protein
MRHFTVTDETGTDGSVTVPADQVAATLRGWFPGAPAEVDAACGELEAALCRGGEPTDGLEAYLGVRVDTA